MQQVTTKFAKRSLLELKLWTAIAKYSDSYQAVSIAKLVKDTIVFVTGDVVGEEL